ncbi:MAG TPA: hypothetical protein PLY87_11225 [Planctomycetaceae bacterium]|nr:hypothetical protein [Planctomycetaceae bacterium]HQZ65642.1 hypothetical protein [Planctomycetaceae bacterium]
METDTLASQQLRLTRRRWFWVISIAFLFLVSMIVISSLDMRGRNRAAIVKRLQKVVRLEPILSAQERSLLDEARSSRLLDGFQEIRRQEAKRRRLLDGPVKVILRCDEYGSVVLPDLVGLEQLDTLHEIDIWPAYLPNSQLNRLPVSPFVRTLRMANFLTVCSETCVVVAADTQPMKPEFAWEGKDMAFLSRLRNLRELELRALWLRTGVLDVVADLRRLEMLSLNRSDFPSDELPSLQRLRNLRVLTFWNTPKSMRSLEWLREMDPLEELTLIGGGHIDAKMLEPLAQLPRLQTLRLDYGNLSDDVWPVLETFQDLRILTLSYTNWFAASRFSPDVGTQDLLSKSPNPEEIQELPSLKHLEWLDIENGHFYTAETLQALLTSLPNDCRVVVNRTHLSKYLDQMPYAIAGRLTGDLRSDLELPVEY